MLLEHEDPEGLNSQKTGQEEGIVTTGEPPQGQGDQGREDGQPQRRPQVDGRLEEGIVGGATTGRIEKTGLALGHTATLRMLEGQLQSSLITR